MALAPAPLLAAFRLPSHRLLVQALHRLGAWPAGPWFTTSAAAAPRGRLLLAHLDAAAAGFSWRLARGRVLAELMPPEQAWQLEPALAITAELDPSGTQARAAAAAATHH